MMAMLINRARPARYSRYRVAGVLNLALCLLAAPASATVVLPVDFAEMVNGSQTIVHGRVIDVRTQMTAGRRSIESIVTLAVVTTMKGETRGTVVLRLPSGRVGRYRRMTVGAPELATGDEVVLFLSGRPPAMPMPFGLSQGVYRVARAEGRAMVAPLVADTPGRVVRGDPARRPLAIEAFAQQVRAVVEAR